MSEHAIGPVDVIVPPSDDSDRDQNPVIDAENEAQDRMMTNYRRETSGTVE